MTNNPIFTKSFLFFASLLLIAWPGKSNAAEIQLKKNNLHNCKIDDSNMLTLVKDGIAKAEIVVPPASSPVAVFAAKELQYFINKATGAKVKIVAKNSPDISSIILGNSEISNSLGVTVDDLPRDGFRIKRIGQSVIIAGKDSKTANPEKALKRGVWAQLYQRGTLFGVYDFLERFAGVRFYFPGEMGTVVPHYSDLKIPAMDITDAPDFIHRKVSAYSGKWFSKESNRFFRPNQEMYRLRAATTYVPNNHGLKRLGLVTRFGQSNSDFFALLANGKRDNDLSLPGHHGHLCYTNTKLKNEIYQDAAAYLSGKPAATRNARTKYRIGWDPSAFQPGFFNIMPQDGHGKNSFCHCPGCWNYYSKNQAGELVWNFIANIAKRLKKNHIPGYITTMAYGPSRAIPQVKIPDNVLVMLAVLGPWAEHVPFMKDIDDQRIINWNKKIAPDKVWLWNYANKYGPRNIKGLPNISPRCIASYYKRNAPHITGAFMESETDQFLFNYLNWYVFYKVAWNNQTDVEALLQEHHEKMFGPAAQPMTQIYDLLEKLWIKALGKTVDTPVGPVGIPPSDNVIWEKIYSQEVIGKMNRLFDEAEKLTIKTPDSNKRVKFIRKNLYGKLLEARNSYFARKNEIEDLVFEVTPALEAITIDGKIGNEWQDASTVSLVPLKGNKALVKTTVYGRWNNKNLYIAVDCREPMVDKLSFTKREHDDKTIWQDASIEIFLNPSDDKKKYYQIIVNPANSLADQEIVADANGKKTYNWNWSGDIEAKTNITNTGWQAELKIPLEKLGLKEIKDGTALVANICRSRNLKQVKRHENQLYTWSPYLTKGFHQLERFGSIHLVKKKTQTKSIIKNGSFEAVNHKNVPVNWSPMRIPNVSKWVHIDQSDFRNGKQSLKLSTPESGKILAVQYLPDLKPNTTYHLTYFVKTQNITPLNNNKGGACVNIWGSQNEWFPKSYYTGSMPWTKQGFIFKTGDDVNNEKNSYIRLRIMNASGNIWLDDIRLREVSSE